MDYNTFRLKESAHLVTFEGMITVRTSTAISLSGSSSSIVSVSDGCTGIPFLQSLGEENQR